MSLCKKFLLPRPSTSTYVRPLKVHVYFAPPTPQLQQATDLILDFPGGGFVAMTPEHHDERLRSWALRTSKPVLSVEYGKAPECNINVMCLSSSY
jgi:acetyl esterase/lipase